MGDLPSTGELTVAPSSGARRAPDAGRSATPVLRPAVVPDAHERCPDTLLSAVPTEPLVAGPPLPDPLHDLALADEQLVDGMTGGVPSGDRQLHSDPHDFAGLYIRHRSSFTLHARRYLRDQRDADEVVQEAFLRLFLALPELETELQALAYCRRTITNLCIDRFRAQARRPHLVDIDSVPVDALADDDPGDPVVRAEDAALVRAALSMLSPLHRAALVKREIEEKTLPVIAEELDIAEDSVKHVLFRARRALRRILTESSLAPGGGGQLSEALAKAVSKGGVAALVAMISATVLLSGPDLRAVPVVGQDLPNLAQIADRIGAAITGGDEAEPPAGPGGGDGPAGPQDPGPGSGLLDPLPVPLVSPSPADTATVGTATGTVGVTPDPAPTTPPAAVPSPTSDPASTPPTTSPSTAPSSAPSPGPVEPTPTGQPSAEAAKPGHRHDPASRPPSPPPVPAPTMSPSDAPTVPSVGPGSAAGTGPAPAVPTSPSPVVVTPSTSAAQDPSAWITPGVVWVLDPDTLEPVLVPEGGPHRWTPRTN